MTTINTSKTVKITISTKEQDIESILLWIQEGDYINSNRQDETEEQITKGDNILIFDIPKDISKQQKTNLVQDIVDDLRAFGVKILEIIK